MTVEQEPNNENKELKKISKIHFLIHPGYDARIAKGIWVDDHAKLFELYVEKAKTLKNKDNELMLAFPFAYSLKEDIEEGARYIAILKKIKDILGDRLIVIADVGDITHSDRVQNSWSKIKKIAGARGYYLDRDVESEAYGEYCEACVSAGAANLNVAGELNKKTIIKPEFTDLYDNPPKIKNNPGNMCNSLEEIRRRIDTE